MKKRIKLKEKIIKEKKSKTDKTKQSDKNKLNNILFIFLRYAILLVIIINYNVLYIILTPLTVYATAFLLKLFYNVFILGNILIINLDYAIKIIPACVAVSAYTLLLILNLSLKMKPKQRFYSLLFSVLALFVLNILRIFFLTIILISKSSSFETIHKIFWYALSILFVVGIWILTIKLFKIKQIPFYSDIRNFFNF